MEFAFSEEQLMLKSQARDFLADKMGMERVAELAESDEGWDPKSWRQMAELGWVGLSAPDAAGGAGMGFIEEAVLFEELGYALYPGPFFSTVGLALPALERHPQTLARVLSGEAAATLAWAEQDGPTRLSESGGGRAAATPAGGSWTLTGEKILVPDLGICDVAVVVASTDRGPGLWLVDLTSDGVDRQVLATMDSTRRLGRLTLADAPARALVAEDETADLLRTITHRARAALALEAVGVAQKVLELAQSYTQDRKQFDKPIGVYQAVSHKLADIYMETELARSLSYWSAWCVAEDERAALASAAAKAAAAEAAVGACERSIQVHGGIGFTWEHVLHRYYKRAQWIESFEGYGGKHRAEVAAHVLAAELDVKGAIRA